MWPEALNYIGLIGVLAATSAAAAPRGRGLGEGRKGRQAQSKNDRCRGRAEDPCVVRGTVAALGHRPCWRVSTEYRLPLPISSGWPGLACLAAEQELFERRRQGDTRGGDLPEVGVESFSEVLEYAAVNRTT